jgi:hypothetical protein
MSRLALTPTNIPALSAAPSYPTLRAGDLYYDTTQQGVYVYSGSAWIATSSSSLPTELDAGVFDSIAPYNGGSPVTTSTQSFNGGTP